MKDIYSNGKEIWEFENETDAAESGEVILGLDGGTTSTVCVCIPLIPFSDPLPDSVPIIARAVAGCSNRNSIGGCYNRNSVGGLFFVVSIVGLVWLLFFGKKG